MSGRADVVEFRVFEQIVEIWYRQRVAGAFLRQDLRGWLAGPGPDPLASRSVILSLDRTVDTCGRVAVSLPDVDRWTIDPHAWEELRRQV
jgi:hypothetical protein